MKRFISFLLLLSFLTACNAQTVTSVPEQPTEAAPTLIPDTPAPAVIDAPIIEAPSLVTIQFLNEMDGWGVTDTQVVRTNDGGVTWYNVTPPDVTETDYSVETFALDDNHMWMQKPDFNNYPNSGFLYRTSDGGITWTMTNVPFSGAKITFLDVNNGWVLADRGVSAGSNAVAVYQTNDGGATWIRTYINDPDDPNAGRSLPLAGLKMGFTPLNMRTAWVHGVAYAPGTAYLYRTDDGGQNWNQVSLPLPEGVENTELTVEQVSFVSPTDGFILMRMTSDQIRLAVYVSKDAGATWLLTPTLIPEAGSADFLSADEVVIFNGAQFYITHDAAHTWSIIPPDIVFGEMYGAMDFVNLLSGWVITLDPTGHRSFYRTSDGGATWFPVIP